LARKVTKSVAGPGLPAMMHFEAVNKNKPLHRQGSWTFICSYHFL